MNQPTPTPPSTPSTTVTLDAADAIEIAEMLMWLRDWFATDTEVLAASMRGFSVSLFSLDEIDEELDHLAYRLGARR